MELLTAGVGAALSIGKGIFGASQADKANKEAKKAHKKQKKAAKQAVRDQNRYNREKVKAEKENYFKQREFEYDTAIKSWNRQKEIQDFEYLNALQRYSKDVDIYSQNKDFSQQAADLSKTNIQANLSSVFKGQMFDREDQIASLRKNLAEGSFNRKLTDLELESVVNQNIVGKLNIRQEMKALETEASFKKQTDLIDSLQKRGDAALRQAGKSRQKGMQSTLAEYYRDTAALTEMLSGKRKQNLIKLAELEQGTATAVKQLGLKKQQIDNAMLEAAYDTEFNMRVLDADVESAIDQAERDIQGVDLQQYGRNLQAFASLSIKPERLSYAPKPEMAPERVFGPALEIDPDSQVPPAPQQQSTWGPLVSGLVEAGTGLLGAYATKERSVTADTGSGSIYTGGLKEAPFNISNQTLYGNYDFNYKPGGF